MLELTKCYLAKANGLGIFSSISAHMSSSTDNMTNFILFRWSPQALSPEKKLIPRIRRGFTHESLCRNLFGRGKIGKVLSYSPQDIRSAL